MIVKALSFCLLALVCYSNAIARDVTVLKLKDCRILKGFFLAIDDDIKFIDLEGSIHYILPPDIDLILTYGISESPFRKVEKFDEKFNEYLKKVKVQNSDETIIGFPFQYIDDLAFILSTSGKVYVIDLKKIIEIQDMPKLPTQKIKSYKNYELDFSDYVGSCEKQIFKGSVNILRPIQILGDQIKVSEYIESYKRGYRSFRDLQERTNFYAKPYLFPKRNRLGVTQIEGGKINIPLYYQWSTGEDFNFQSMNAFGGRISDYLPLYDPGFVFSSAVKSHFFHGYFEGNLFGLSAGKIPVDFEGVSIKRNAAIMNFNYVAFMGFDWKKFSFSYGGGYFSPYLIFDKKELRQLASNRLSNAIKFQYTGNQINISSIAYIVDDKSSSTFEIDDQVKIVSKNKIATEDIDSFTFKANYYRANISYQLTENIEIGGDTILGAGEYSEKATTDNSIDYRTTQYLLSVKKQFGHYISLKIIMRSSNTSMQGDFLNRKKESNLDEKIYGGVFELLF